MSKNGRTRKSTSSDAQQNTNQDARIQDLEKQIQMMDKNNDRLLTLMERQMDRVQEDDDGKYHKRLVAHQPPQYNGEPNPVKFEDWIAQLEKTLDMLNVPEHLKVKLAAFNLSGPAELWWRTVKTTMTTTN